MRKIYLSLVIVLASVFMANEASAQQYFAIDNQRGDNVRVEIWWFSCGVTAFPVQYNVCANSILTIVVPMADGLIQKYRTDQTTFICSGNCNYRIDSPPAPFYIPVKTNCTDYSLTVIRSDLWSGITGGTVLGTAEFHYLPGGLGQGSLALFP